jgi:MFS family permease
VAGTYREALMSVMRNRNLRTAQLSSFAAWSGEFLFITTTTVYAFEQNGAAGAALIGFLRVLPAAIALPLVGALADRISRRSLLIGVTSARTLTAGGAAIAAAADQPVVVYVLVTLSTISHAAYRPTLGAMLPSLCTSPEELAGSNAVRSVLDGLAGLIGPLVAAFLLAAFSPPAAFVAVAVLSVSSLLLVGALQYDPPPVAEPVRRSPGVLADIGDGLRELRRSPHGSIVIALGILQSLVRGALTVFAVIVAVNLTGMGKAGVGVLWAAFGVGGLVAALASLGAAGSKRLGTVFGVGIATWGLPLILCGVATHSFAVVAAFTVIGAANALVDVSGFTLLQRVTPDRMLARVLTLAEAVFALATALGSLVVPPIDAALGHADALIVIGCLLPSAVVVSYPLLRAMDRHIGASTERIALLRRVGMLRLLPVPAIESLAAGVTMLHVPAGVDVIRKGDIGDNFYVIESGRMILLDGGHEFGELGPGDSFGEIALLRRVLRTITVRAAQDADLAVVSGPRFVAAVNGFSATASTAEEIVGQHLLGDQRRHAEGGGQP